MRMNISTRPHFLAMSIFCFSAVFLACGNADDMENEPEHEQTEHVMAFSSERWKTKDGEDYPYREQMIDKVLHNDSLRAMQKDAILELLGDPDRSNDGYLYYTITQKRLFSWPLHTTTMVIKLSDDNSVEWIKLHE